jgi:hypothetical protein
MARIDVCLSTAKGLFLDGIQEFRYEIPSIDGSMRWRALPSISAFPEDGPQRLPALIKPGNILVP